MDEWLCQEFMFQIPTVLLCSPDCAGLVSPVREEDGGMYLPTGRTD